MGTDKSFGCFSFFQEEKTALHTHILRKHCITQSDGRRRGQGEKRDFRKDRRRRAASKTERGFIPSDAGRVWRRAQADARVHEAGPEIWSAAAEENRRGSHLLFNHIHLMTAKSEDLG